MSRWPAFALFALAFLAASWLWRQPAPSDPKKETLKPEDDVTQLIERLRAPANKVRYYGNRLPGGEILGFSEPMSDLTRRGARARVRLHERIDDVENQNEIVLILGAIGDRTTVPLLIEAYPEGDVATDESAWMKVICFTHALTYLTCQPIGRNRWGADFNPTNRERWRAWWRDNGAAFVIPAEKPNFTWVPGYPEP